MDAFNVNQLKIMSYGGNRRFQEYLANYDLMEESVATRYSTQASDYYRNQLRSKVDGTRLPEGAPQYEQGRQQVPTGESRSYE